ncbi:uncharacterized protein LOC131853522 [Achroia grisella]|uniref:uncharacterized protein LOC131853522 n=1 Tax=Achroia grisella TaxID=688607 RepID=UPI0027D32A27|nr:uncharacterized protein LOC131853522 [Achroia grisella]XP_059060419.1 uncharacterized protein LOC131853522 [Achroia grisella]
MSGEVESEAQRPRPLSGGLWTIFSWLRREEHTSSSDSLSSAGSDRTVASFAFLSPAHYRTATTPVILPPPGPPTDSYKKRVREINIRRQNDRDLTLHRKYGLHRGEGSTYDAFSLPPPRRYALNSIEKHDRDRRATSELLQLRAAYVPGKRRAPAPPVCISPVAISSLVRRPTRKRPAPQPPTKFIDSGKQNCKIHTQMNSQVECSQNTLPGEISMDCKPEKYIRKDANSKENKTKQEKSFLKQIFDNRKRNSAIDISAIKILPSISELDKQAAEIIESSKRKDVEGNRNLAITRFINDCHNLDSNDTWLCITCSRKYNKSVTNCRYCLSKQKDNFSDIKNKNDSIHTQTENELMNVPSTSRLCANDEKQKLREMLKEMKDSLPKRPKHDNIGEIKKTNAHHQKTTREDPSSEDKLKVTESPTLRIGSTLLEQDNHIIESSKEILYPKNQNDNKKNIFSNPKDQEDTNAKSHNSIQIKETIPKIHIGIENYLKSNNLEVNVNGNRPDNINTPLRISSLLNPVYIPKSSEITKEQFKKNFSNGTLLKLQLKKRPSLEDKTITTNIGNSIISTTQGSIEPSTSNSKSNSEEKILSTNKISTVLLSASSGTPSTSSSTGQKILSHYEKSVTNEEINNHSAKNNLSKENTKNKLQVLQPNVHSTVPEDQINETGFTKFKPTLLNNEDASISNVDKINQHTRRRDLVNQLEQSIAKGDEHAAAQAAIKLAQLRLSCSVLSFSSQILGEASTSLSNESVDKTKIDNKSCKPVIKQTSVKKIIDQPLTKSVNSGTQTLLAATKENSNVINVQKTNKKPIRKQNSREHQENNELKDSSVHNDESSSLSQKCNDQASTSKKIEHDPSQNDIVTISVWVEDKEAARGPVQLRISRQARLGHLRRRAETSLGIASRLQRWIIGRTLCTDDNTHLMSLAGPNLNAPFYLCLVECEIETNTGTSNGVIISQNQHENDDNKKKSGEVYTELVKLEREALVPNAESFQCEVCMEECMAGRGAVLRECIHTFCRDCLSDLIRHCEEPAVLCPATNCPGILHEREIRALVAPDEYERWLARGLATAESRTRNAFHCRTHDCTGWAYCEPGVQRFPCPVCKSNNCVPCQAIHEGETCEQYRTKLQKAVGGNKANQTDEGTRALLDSLISRGEALECPECSAIITKKWGCDWVKCSACKTEICWVTRGRRWGPGGKGDTSEGCRCGIDGKKCHPSCGYCH